MKTKLLVSSALACMVACAAMVPSATAHTESDVIAVPAGEQATITLKPTHGCDGSPTVEVAIQAPVSGAVAGDVPGWTATATEDGGTTVLEWTGGTLPADQVGAFPVTFSAPDTVGEVLTFPSVQVCDDGEELAWISGDPDDEYPAPRLLILAAGSPAATEIGQIPPDAPGRDQLSQVLDLDNPSGPGPTTTAPGPTSSSTTPDDDTASEAVADLGDDAGAVDDGDDEQSSGSWFFLAGVVLVVVLGVGGAVLVRRRAEAAT